MEDQQTNATDFLSADRSLSKSQKHGWNMVEYRVDAHENHHNNDQYSDGPPQKRSRVGSPDHLDMDLEYNFRLLDQRNQSPSERNEIIDSSLVIPEGQKDHMRISEQVFNGSESPQSTSSSSGICDACFGMVSYLFLLSIRIKTQRSQHSGYRIYD